MSKRLRQSNHSKQHPDPATEVVEEQLALSLDHAATIPTVDVEPEAQDLGLKGLRLKRKYSTYRHDLYVDFYCPVLAQAAQYDRKSGFFSSVSLSKLAQGLEVLLQRQATMRLVMGHSFSEPEYREIVNLHKSRQPKKTSATEGDSEPTVSPLDVILTQALLAPLQPPENPLQAERLQTIALLLQAQQLEIRIALPISPTGFLHPRYNQFLERVGIIRDRFGNQVTFNGSNDESIAGWGGNLESFHVFCDWRKGDEERVQVEVKDFEDLWQNKLKRKVLLLELPEAVRDRLLAYAVFEESDFGELDTAENSTVGSGPAVPEPDQTGQTDEVGASEVDFEHQFADEFLDDQAPVVLREESQTPPMTIAQLQTKRRRHRIGSSLRKSRSSFNS